MVTEAVVIKATSELAKQRKVKEKEAEREAFRKSHKKMPHGKG